MRLLEIFKLKGQKKRTEIEVSMLVEIKKRSERKRKSLVKKDRQDRKNCVGCLRLTEFRGRFRVGLTCLRFLPDFDKSRGSKWMGQILWL